MPDYNDGNWHGWNGGECPVHPKSEVQVTIHEGLIYVRLEIVQAGSLEWDADDSPVIAFRVVKKFEEPKVIWVNEYTDEFCGHSTKEGAEKAAHRGRVLRAAVKFVESPDD